MSKKKLKENEVLNKTDNDRKEKLRNAVELYMDFCDRNGKGFIVFLK